MDVSRIEFLRRKYDWQLNEEKTHVVVNRGEKVNDVVCNIVHITQPWKAENGGMMYQFPEYMAEGVVV